MATLFSVLTVALLLVFAKKVDQKANLFLSSALVVIILKAGGITSLFLPALGHLIYFHVRQLTSFGHQFNRKDLLHLSLLLAGYWIPGWLICISVIIYLYLAHRLIDDFYHRMKPVLIDKPRFAFRGLDRALLLLGILCLLPIFNDVFWILFSIVLIGMAALAMLKRDGDAQLTIPVTDRSDAREKARRLKEAVTKNRLYEDAELTLTTMAMKLNIHPHDLSRIINVGLEKNFSDLINEFRVREIIRKMRRQAYQEFNSGSEK